MTRLERRDPDLDYHRGDIQADLIGRGHEQSEKALAGAMRVPEEAVHARLRVARQRLNLARDRAPTVERSPSFSENP